MRTVGWWIGVVALVSGCGPRLSDDPDTPVVIVDSNNESNATSNARSNGTNNPATNAGPNNEPDNAVTMQQSLEQSGSRYKAKVLQSRGGAQSFVGWYDTDLEVDCSLSTEDGKCIPSIVLSVGQRGGTSSSGTTVRPIFSDAACSNSIGISTNGQGCIDVRVGDYVGIRGNDTTNCQGQQVSRVEEYAKVLSTYDGPAYRWAGDTCEVDDGVERFETGERIPRTAIPGWTDALID